jgi:hypothetical protein
MKTNDSADELVEEVRTAREAYTSKHNFDVRRIVEDLKARQITDRQELGIRPVEQWTEADIKLLIRENRPENISLEYKKSDALANNEKNKKEIAKDVSAMANSAGGVLIYGVDENKPTGPIRFDGGVDPQKTSTEWIEQIIDSNVARRIPSVRVIPVPMMSEHTDHVVYVVSVPQSSLAPHMASDHRFYKRLGTITAMMEEYEIRDVARRSESPDLDIHFEVRHDQTSVLLIPWLTNTAPEPAFYATFNLYISTRANGKLIRVSMRDWNHRGRVDLRWKERETETFETFHLFWGIPERPPFLEGETYKEGAFEFPAANPPNPVVHRIACEIRSPKMPTRFYGRVLEINSSSATLHAHRHTVRQI